MTAGELSDMLDRWPADTPVMVCCGEEGAHVLSDVSEVYRMSNGTVIIEG